MKRKHSAYIMALVWLACLVAIGGQWGWRAAVLAWFSGCCVAAAAILADDDRDAPKRESCDGCRHNLGGGDYCNIGMIPECRGGGGFELWEE